MDPSITLSELLGAVISDVDTGKVDRIQSALERSYAVPSTAILIEDPMVLRRRLADQLKEDGVSAGVVHSYEQLFMGIVRRGALKGLILAPPEGPWTLAWQQVLDSISTTRGLKAALRSLAGWATAHDLTPDDITEAHLQVWARDLRLDRQMHKHAKEGLNRWMERATSPGYADGLREVRLRRRHEHGSVFQSHSPIQDS